MKYYGKRYLYNFLKERGYNVPQFSEMEYKCYRGSEWLKSYPLTLGYDTVGLEVYVDGSQRNVIRVVRNELSEDDIPYQVELSKYVDGDLNYQQLNYRVTFINGLRYLQ